jgi:DNA (cytosine-5)-methyltransferase 1
MKKRRPYIWKLSKTTFTKDQGKVFSCFACGGGSTMGYKLAGFDVLGCNEIDPRMAKAYVANHHPKYCYVEPIQTFRKRKDLPKELYNLDILDGSPPCSSFSMAGAREKMWGVKHKFREGQQEQVLDTLFFDFIALANKLRPKVVIAENVKGMLAGRAREYVAEVLRRLDKCGYYVNYLILDASTVGVPQKRERIFFYAVRKDLWPSSNLPNLKIRTFGRPILFGSFARDSQHDHYIKHGILYRYWKKRILSDNGIASIAKRVDNRSYGFGYSFLHNNKIASTRTARGTSILYSKFREPNKRELCCMGTFPQDYDFAGSKPAYITGMSVPPFMLRAVAEAIRDQILPKLKTIPVTSNATANKRKVLWLRRNVNWSKKKCRMQKLLK